MMHLKDITEEFLDQPHEVWLASTIKNNMHNIELAKNSIKRHQSRIDHEKRMIEYDLEYIGKMQRHMTVGHVPYGRVDESHLKEISPSLASAIKVWIDRTLNGYSENGKCELIYLMMEHCSERLLNPLPDKNKEGE